MYTGKDLDWFAFVIAAQLMFVERNTITTNIKAIFNGLLKIKLTKEICEENSYHSYFSTARIFKTFYQRTVSNAHLAIPCER